MRSLQAVETRRFFKLSKLVTQKFCGLEIKKRWLQYVYIFNPGRVGAYAEISIMRGKQHPSLNMSIFDAPCI